MRNRVKALVATAALVCLIPAASFAQISAFSQNFEALDAGDLDALANDDWLVYASVFDGDSGDFLYGYGSFPAPNNPDAPAFCNIVLGEGGAEQGAQQLSVFSDYENGEAHAAGDIVEANVFREFTIDATDVGKTWTFEFQAKRGNLQAPSTAIAFIKTIDPQNNFDQTNLVSEDMTAIPTEWGGWSLSLTIDAGLVGQFFQVGFANTATNFDPSAIIYDNVVLSETGGPVDQIEAYSQDFEGLDAGSLTALADDGWLVFANVFDDVSGDLLYSYGPNPAPNNPAAPAFCTIAVGEGGPDQGAQQLSVFSDYENGEAHAAGDIVEAIVYREQIIGAPDVGKTWIFEFQAKRGNLEAPSTAEAFIKTIDPDNGFATTNNITADMTTIPTEWGGYSVSLTIDAGLVGQLFQIGFANTATFFAGSSIIYDNVVLRESVVSVPDATPWLGAALGQNYPNPFNPSTRIEFSVEKPGSVDISVYDLGGRLVTNLVNTDLAAGDHYVTWNGRTDSGAAAAAGQYFYVMKTAGGQVSRSMVLLK